MSYDFLKQILSALQQYEKEQQAAQGTDFEPKDLTHFANWILMQPQEKAEIQAEPQATVEAQEKSSPPTFGGETLDTIIGKYLGLLNRYMKNYVKIALENSDFYSIDDFTYLGTLLNAQLQQKQISKTELISEHVHEKTTGIEILKRLQKNNFITEAAHLQDKRKKQLLLTPKGREAFFTHVERMQKVGVLLGAGLAQAEKKQLVYLLQKLHDFHLYFNQQATTTAKESEDSLAGIDKLLAAL
ncbi:MarR family winged helix-turn-helix transcriptional regulator [Hugenholtzia roseola]|uniref:MarR family winged helix-turn-helix transcriptional regulator n=1 Tax=Hugenholtzia roseola TaxID=1002 RepID=UPI00040F17A7|nr:MarR family winged helix-turn-helix transcriptional regulator [Hugenholtzia roseola]